MANLGYFKIEATNDYDTLENITQLTFTEGNKYNFQVVNASAQLTCCILDTKPTEGGTVMKDYENFSYTPKSGVSLYLKVSGIGCIYLNVAE